MAAKYKIIGPNDLVSTRTLLHEAIPITGTIVSGTYASDGNIQNYSRAYMTIHILVLLQTIFSMLRWGILTIPTCPHRQTVRIQRRLIFIIRWPKF